MAKPHTSRLSHVDDAGRARMVEITDKPSTRRHAVAVAEVCAARETVQRIRDHALAKGDALAVAEIAGIQAAKRTAELIPLAHPIRLTHVEVRCRPVVSRARIRIQATARCREGTGVEMEALTAATVAALTIYDMAKAVDPGMTIQGVRLVEKGGGKSGPWKRD